MQVFLKFVEQFVEWIRRDLWPSGKKINASN